MKDRSAKVNHFLLQEQFPDIIKAAGADKGSGNASKPSAAADTGYYSSNTKQSVSRRVVKAVDEVTQLRLERCRCPHLEEYLPRVLDLTCCRVNANNQYHPQGVSLSNPVHALHMVASESGSESSPSTAQKQRVQPTFMYGEEQQRTHAMRMEGIPEYLCSFDEKVPTLASELPKATSNMISQIRSGLPQVVSKSTITSASLANKTRPVVTSQQELVSAADFTKNETTELTKIDTGGDDLTLLGTRIANNAMQLPDPGSVPNKAPSNAINTTGCMDISSEQLTTDVRDSITSSSETSKIGLIESRTNPTSEATTGITPNQNNSTNINVRDGESSQGSAEIVTKTDTTSFPSNNQIIKQEENTVSSGSVDNKTESIFSVANNNRFQSQQEPKNDKKVVPGPCSTLSQVGAHAGSTCFLPNNSGTAETKTSSENGNTAKYESKESSDLSLNMNAETHSGSQEISPNVINNDRIEQIKQIGGDTIPPNNSKPNVVPSTAEVFDATSMSASTSQITPIQSTLAPTSPPPNPIMDIFRQEEEKILRIQKFLSSKRVRKKSDSTPTEDNKKKRRKDLGSNIPGLKCPPMIELNAKQEEKYIEISLEANETTERWIHQYRLCRELFWMEKQRQEQTVLHKVNNTFYLNPDLEMQKMCCVVCSNDEKRTPTRRVSKNVEKGRRNFIGDELMRCLDCGFIACSPPSLNSDSKYHMQHHLLTSGHKFAVSCGEKARIFCFDCGDYVYHEIFEHEKIRIACTKKFPFMSWKDSTVLRSFDPFQFIKTQDNGIIWRGLVATYPPMVPKEHFCAVELTLRRQALFEGKIDEKWILPKSNALYFAASQHIKKDEVKYKIAAPVGIYNLGNTCFISSILQCLVFCKPLQTYFLRDCNHHYKSCEAFRHKEDVLTAAAAAAAKKAQATLKSKKVGNLQPSAKKKTQKIEPEVCLACECDRLFLSYFGASTGHSPVVPLEESSKHLLFGNYDECPVVPDENIVVPIEKGNPLIISDLLTSAWKSGGSMTYLTGYDQHDAHEFLNSFLELLGKHIVKYRKRINDAVIKVHEENAFAPARNLGDAGKFAGIFPHFLFQM